LSNAQIRDRDGHRCARCGHSAAGCGGVLDVHHRQLRSADSTIGNEAAFNRVTLGRRCHDWAHSDKGILQARQEGWLVPRHGDPARIPIENHVLWPGTVVLLTADGGFRIWQGGDGDGDQLAS
jgi:hypothetical protein